MTFWKGAKTACNLTTKQGRYLARKAGVDVPKLRKGPKPEAFWSLVDKTETCWLWKGHINADGYGQRRQDGIQGEAHRVAWRLTHGDIPKGRYVLHRCDVRHCVNPAHLFLGTNDENMADMVRKGRQPMGERNAASKLTEAAVRDIRANPHSETVAQRAKRFGIGLSTAYEIINRKRWAHVS